MYLVEVALKVDYGFVIHRIKSAQTTPLKLHIAIIMNLALVRLKVKYIQFYFLHAILYQFVPYATNNFVI